MNWKTIAIISAAPAVIKYPMANFFILNAKRKKAERALRTSQARFEAQFRDSPIPTFTWQKKGDDFELVDYNNKAITWAQSKISSLKGSRASQLYADRTDIIEEYLKKIDNYNWDKPEKEFLKKFCFFLLKSKGNE